MGELMTIPLSRPDITDLDRRAVSAVLASDSLSLGPQLPEFEHALAEAAGTRFAVAVNSGTSALHLCIKAADIGPDDEVVTSPFSFVASANCVLFEQGRPVFVDIDPSTFNIDPNLLERAIGPRTRALLPVHVFGRPADMDSILKIARRRALMVIEDSCEAIGAKIGQKTVGSFGDAGVFAFYPNKQITTGEGGAVVTDSDHIAGLCRSWRNQGRGESGTWLQHERIGYNYRLSDINCALGITQLSRLGEIKKLRAAVARGYFERLLARVPEVIPPPDAERDTEISWFVYVVRLHDEFTVEDRDSLLEFLKENGIGCSNYFSPIHLQPFYRERFGYRRGDFPITERIADRTIALPFHNRLTEAETDCVVSKLREGIDRLGTGRGQVAFIGSDSHS
jgi:perosamine synthetase